MELSTWDSKSCTLASVITYPMPREQQHSTVRGGYKERQKVKMFSFGFVWEHVYDGAMHNQGIPLVRGNYFMHERLMNTLPPWCILASARHHQLHEGTRRWDHYSLVPRPRGRLGPLLMCMCIVLQALQHHSCVLVCKPVRKHNSSNLIGPHVTPQKLQELEKLLPQLYRITTLQLTTRERDCAWTRGKAQGSTAQVSLYHLTQSHTQTIKQPGYEATTTVR